MNVEQERNNFFSKVQMTEYFVRGYCLNGLDNVDSLHRHHAYAISHFISENIYDMYVFYMNYEVNLDNAFVSGII